MYHLDEMISHLGIEAFTVEWFIDSLKRYLEQGSINSIGVSLKPHYS